MKRNYTQVRKVAWDALWHAVFFVNNEETWDRVEENEAIAISRKLHHSTGTLAVVTKKPATKK